MKAWILLAAPALLLAAAPASRAQTVLQGDSAYQALQSRRDSLASVVARLGRHYHKREILSWFHARLRDGGSFSGTNVVGYALHYKKLGVAFCVDNEKGHLDEIHFDSTASIISARGIRPGAAGFAEVIKTYGLPPDSDQHDGSPKIVGRWEVNKKGDRQYYLALSYGSIRFISWGRRVTGENLLARRVQEIWLR